MLPLWVNWCPKAPHIISSTCVSFQVILSASSTFFRDLLANDHPQPLLLRGLKVWLDSALILFCVYNNATAFQGSDLISVVDFIYHGEVEVEKDSLYDFLAIGEKLKLKGLAKTPEHSASQVKTILIFSVSKLSLSSMMLSTLLLHIDRPNVVVAWKPSS